MGILKKYKHTTGFTIVELLIVVVVIAILAAITIVAYNGVSQRAKEASAKTTANSARTKILTYAGSNNENYPADLNSVGLVSDANTTLTYTVNNSADPKTFCVTVIVSSVSYYVSNAATTPTSGTCPPASPPDGSYIQTITTTNCPNTRIRTLDARDNATYWVQKMADGKCWMLTNLGYAGGGTNTYGDTKSLTYMPDLDASSSIPYYYSTANANITTGSTNPSVSTDGGATNPQYGYLYNWCAAMGVQTTTAACTSNSTPVANPAISICPSGWRLPTGGVGGEFEVLTNLLGPDNYSRILAMKDTLLFQYAGNGKSSTTQDYVGSRGYYWSSTKASASSANSLEIRNGNLNATSYSILNNATYGYSVRCISN